MFAALVRHGPVWSFYSSKNVRDFSTRSEAEGWIKKIHPSLKPFLWDDSLTLLADEPSERIKRIYNLFLMMQKRLLQSDVVITDWELFLFDELFHILYEEFYYTF